MQARDQQRLSDRDQREQGNEADDPLQGDAAESSAHVIDPASGQRAPDHVAAHRAGEYLIEKMADHGPLKGSPPGHLYPANACDQEPSHGVEADDCQHDHRGNEQQRDTVPAGNFGDLIGAQLRYGVCKQRQRDAPAQCSRPQKTSQPSTDRWRLRPRATLRRGGVRPVSRRCARSGNTSLNCACRGAGSIDKSFPLAGNAPRTQDHDVFSSPVVFGADAPSHGSLWRYVAGLMISGILIQCGGFEVPGLCSHPARLGTSSQKNALESPSLCFFCSAVRIEFAAKLCEPPKTEYVSPHFSP